MPKIDIYAKVSRNESFRRIRDAKLSYKMHDLCNRVDGTAELEDFVREVFSYRFTDEPNYDKLRMLLDMLCAKYNSKPVMSVSKCKNEIDLVDTLLVVTPVKEQKRATLDVNLEKSQNG